MKLIVTRSFVSFVALAAFVAFAARPAAAAVHIGELEPLSVGTAHPYAPGTGENARSWAVRYPAATYIRIHFSRFDLAPGDTLELSGGNGRERFTYAGRGPDGTGDFWANVIEGDTATLTLNAPTGGGFGFEADSFGRGTIAVGQPGGPGGGGPSEPESVCGVQDYRDVECYDPSTEYDKSKAVVIEYIGCCTGCTAFKVSDSGQFLTNNHCASTAAQVSTIELRSYYQTPGCGTGTATYNASVRGNTLLRTDATLDYTLFTTTGDASGVPCASLDNRLPSVGERIYIAGHPGAGPKQLTINSDLDAGGKCTVGAAPCAGNSATSDVCYYCDTAGGSSGSPVFSGSTNKVVALHHFGGCFNSGGRMDLIYPQIASQLGSCSGGGPAVCGNGVKESGEACDGSDLGGQTCQSQGYSGGTLACNANCTLNTSGCTACTSRGNACTANNQCCSGNCGGKAGRKTCK